MGIFCYFGGYYVYNCDEYICICLCVDICSHFCWVNRSRIPKVHCKSMFNYLKKKKKTLLNSKVIVPFHTTPLIWDLSCLTCQPLVWSVFTILTIIGSVVVSHCDYHFHITNDVIPSWASLVIHISRKLNFFDAQFPHLQWGLIFLILFKKVMIANMKIF